MRQNRTGLRITTVLLPVFLAAFLLISCSGDDSIKPEYVEPVPFNGAMLIPVGWQGVWEMTFDLIDEETGQMHASTIWSDTLCTGDSLSVTFGPMMSACNGYIQGDSLIFSAQNSWDEGPCTVTMFLVLRALRQGGFISGAGEWRLETSGSCGGSNHVIGRELIEMNGMRIATVSGEDCQ